MSKSFVAIVALALGTAASAQTSTCPSRLFVSGYYSTVHVFDACTGAYLRDLDGNARIKGPQAVKLGPDGLIYVTSEGTEQILRYRNDTLEFVDVFATFTGVDPTGFAFGPDGSVYVAGYRTSDVRRLSAAGVAIDMPVPKGAAGLKGPDNGITFGPDGNLYVPGYDSSNVVRYDPRKGATTVAVASGAKDLRNTRGLLPEKGGAALLITGEGSSQVLRLDLATGEVAEVNFKVVKPTGIAYGVDGSVLILERNTVRKLDPVTFAITGTLVAPGAGGVDFGTYLAVIPLPQPPKQAVVEYYHAGLDHYFISALPADIAALDSGALKGWARTGRAFNAYLSPADGTNPVCRFYLPPANGDSHFYSASAAECADVRAKFPSFTYEAADVMYVALPDLATGLCPEGLVPVYRLWNNRADYNHRYTAEVADNAAMLAKGYVPEGYGPDSTIMCAAA